jgi:hypothetical protein
MNWRTLFRSLCGVELFGATIFQSVVFQGELIMTNPFQTMNDETFSAAMYAAVSNPETLKLWAEESQRRQDELKAKVIAAETARTAAKPTGKPGFTRHGVPCILWPGLATTKNPNPADKCQVDRHAVVLTLPATVSTVNETTKNGKTSSTTQTVSYGPSIVMWLPQTSDVGIRGAVNLTPSDNLWFPSGSNKTGAPTESAAVKATDLVSDVHDCYVQETEHSELKPATARKVTAAEFKKHAVQSILAWHKTHGKG